MKVPIIVIRRAREIKQLERISGSSRIYIELDENSVDHPPPKMNFPFFAWMASIATAQTLRVRGGRSLQSFVLASNDPALGEDGISVDLASVYAVPGSRALRKSTKSSKIFLTKSSKTVVPTNAELASEIEELKAVIAHSSVESTSSRIARRMAPRLAIYST